MSALPPRPQHRALKQAADLGAVLAQRDALGVAARAVQESLRAFRELATETDFLCHVEREDGLLAMRLWSRDNGCGSGVRRSAREEGFSSRVEKAVDEDAWRHLFHAIGYDKLLDSEGRDQLDRQLLAGEFLPFTDGNVRATLDELEANKEQTFAAGVESVFRALSPNHKSNEPAKFGAKMVVQNSAFWDAHRQAYRADWSAERLNDLLKFMLLADRQPIGARFTDWATEEFARTRSALIEHDYFTVKAHKNGNLHLAFKRPDLVDALNRVLAKSNPNALAGPTRNA